MAGSSGHEARIQNAPYDGSSPGFRGLSEAALRELVAASLRDPGARWAIGVIGAIAEFEPHGPHRSSAPGDCGDSGDFVGSNDPDGPGGADPALRGLSAMAPFGAIRVGPLAQARALAYELPSADRRAWLHGVVFCLPEARARGPARRGITELGPDTDAARAADRAALLFDLGIGSPWCEVCIRTGDQRLIELLRAHLGRDLLDPAHDLLARIPQASPARVFRSQLARIEVWQRIPRHGEPSPEGSHTHFLPKLLRPARPVQATVPVPEGWVACLSLFPPHPLRDRLGLAKPFDRGEHEAFQALLARCADPDYLEAKRLALDAAAAGTLSTAAREIIVNRTRDRQGAGGGHRATRIRHLAAIVAARQHGALHAAQG